MAVDILTNIIINGQTTAGFNALAGRLQNLGSAVEQVGGTVREFETQGVDIYRGYEDNMLAAQYALSAQYDSASELNKVMKDLDNYASNWAAHSIFHTSDVSKAINEAAHAGWDYTEIVQGIPQAMLIAQAGGMELSSGLDYLIKMMNSTETEFDKMGTLIDQWAKASNLSATNIGEMGEAFMSLGSSAQFADSTQEIFALLAALANVGTVGSQAGTAVRSAMVRIIAPTSKAEDAMDLLGADIDEINEVLSDTSVTKAAKTLEGLGFSAYDAQGDLKPMIQIFGELNTALKGLEEAAQNEIISAIFPTRTISTAKAFLSAIESGDMAELFQSIGDSEGYAAKGADIMMSGLTGSVETMLSKWEELERRTGETLAPMIEDAAGKLGEIIDAVNGLDEGPFSALVGSASTLATLGPGLMLAGGAIKLFTTLGPYGTGFLLAAMAVNALAASIKKVNEIKFGENFGTMQLDLDALGEHVDGLSSKFERELGAITEWEAALEAAEAKYASTSTKLAESMLTDVLTGKTLTEDEKNNLYDYAEQLKKAVWDGLENAEASDMSFLEALFGDATTPEEVAVGENAAEAMSAWYSNFYGEAAQIGQELRDKMTEALRDGNLDAAEQEAIQASVDRYNQIMAAIQSQMSSEDYYRQLYKSQSVDVNSFRAFAGETEQKRDESLEKLDDTYADSYARLAKAYEWNIENGLATEEDWQATEAAFYAERDAAIQGEQERFGQLIADAFDQMMRRSDFGDAWKFMKGLSRDSEGNFDFSNAFAGMNVEELDALNGALAHMFNNSNELEKLIGGFDAYPGVDNFMRMIEGSGQAAREASQASSGLSLRQEAWDTYVSGLESDLSDAESRLSSLEQQKQSTQEAIDSLKARINADNYSPWDNFWGTSKETDMGALENQQAQLEEINAQIAEAENMVNELQTTLNELTPPDDLTVVPDLDTTAIDEYQPPTKTMTVIAITKGVGGLVSTYAEGGRATEASVFGEDGAEWAIPEEHSDRTAELLNAARAASGFSWGELISRFGGLNANPKGKSMTINYAPVINAGNAGDLTSALAADKDRLMRMLRRMMDEQRFRDEVEVYA